MGRPRKDSGIKPVRTRIVNALWELFDDRSLEQITVQDIADTAGCNRTTFYRHYADMQDLIEAVEDSLTPSDLPGLVTESFVDDEGYRRLSAYLIEEDLRFRQIARLLGPTGDPAFADRLRSAMIDGWSQHLGADPRSFEPRQLLLFQFLSGGVFATLGYWNDNSPDLQFEEFARIFLRDILGTIVPLLPGLLVSGPSSDGAAALP